MFTSKQHCVVIEGNANRGNIEIYFNNNLYQVVRFTLEDHSYVGLQRRNAHQDAGEILLWVPEDTPYFECNHSHPLKTTNSDTGTINNRSHHHLHDDAYDSITVIFCHRYPLLQNAG